jgi:hypothetical protein
MVMESIQSYDVANNACMSAGPSLFWFSYVFSVVSALGITIVVYGYIWTLFSGKWYWEDYFTKNLTQFMGILYASGASLIAVVLFTATAGPIKINLSSVIEFEGASIPLIMWMLIFLVICIGIRILQPKH